MTATNVNQGPIDDRVWPEHIASHVVEAGASPRIRGFDVHADLARHYRFGELLLIALTGTPPDVETGRAFDVALAFAAPISVAEAPAHAAALARLCGARTAGIFAVAATALSEQSRTTLDEHDAVLPRLVIGSLNGMAARYAARDDDERAAVQRLRSALGAFAARVPSLGYDLRLDTAIIAVLLACGLRVREHLELALSMARLPAACAEAFSWTPGDLKAYPMNTPAFAYSAAAGAT